MDEGTELAIARRGDDPIVMRLIHERDKLRAEVERLLAALEKHHNLLSDEPGDCCQTCDLDYLGRPKEC